MYLLIVFVCFLACKLSVCVPNLKVFTVLVKKSWKEKEDLKEILRNLNTQPERNRSYNKVSAKRRALKNLNLLLLRNRIMLPWLPS